MGTAISPLLNPVIRGLWWMLMAKACLLDSSLRRLLEADSNTTIASNILCFFSHFFFYFSFLHIPFPRVSFPSSPFIPPRQPFSLSFFHSLHFLIRIFISLTISPCSLLFLTTILTHKTSSFIRPCLIPLWWTLHFRNTKLWSQTILLLLIHPASFFLYTTNPIQVHMLDIYCPSSKFSFCLDFFAILPFLHTYKQAHLYNTTIQILCTILCA